MQASAQPIIFQSLSAKLVDSGIKINTTMQKDMYIDGMQTTLQISTLMLTCLVALQLCIDSASIHEQNVLEWKRKFQVADHELQQLRIREQQMKGELVIFQHQVEDYKQEIKTAAEKEEREFEKRKAMVHAAVNTEATEKKDAATNTYLVEVQHKETSTEHLSLEENGTNVASKEQVATKNASTEEQGTRTISEASTTNLLHAENGTEVVTDGQHAEPTSADETQELELLRKQVKNLTEELNKLNNIPSQRVTSVTTWEKNYQSDLQGPLLRYINSHMQGHSRLSHVLPANPDRHINRATYDGVLLSNPAILDERVINFVPTSDLEVIQNFTLTINTAIAMGCAVPTTNPELLLADPHLMLDMLYQLVKCELYGKITVAQHPSFVRLRKETESPSKFRGVAAAELLHRWANHHLATTADPRNMSQLLSAEDLRTLFSSVSPTLRPLLDDQDWIVSLAHQAGIKYPSFLDETTIGNLPLQSLFLAQLAHASPGLAQLSESEMKRETEDERDADPQGTREERAFVMWMNGLGIPVFVSNLQHDMSDGLVLLHTLDKIERGSINWKEVNSNPNNAYKKVENCNLGLKVCVSKLSFSLVGIGGKDIFDGNRKLILAVIWQACKYHLLAALRKCGNGVEVTESDVLGFINKRIPQPINAFKDSSLRTALPLLDLLLHLAPDVVKQENIRRRFPMSPEDCLLNAKYAIGLARKIFVLPPSSTSPAQPDSSTPAPTQRDIPLCLPILPEDLLEVNPKMLFIFVAMMMLVDKMKKPQVN